MINKFLNFLKNLNKTYYLLVALILLFGITTKEFFTIGNIQNILLYLSFDGIIAIGMVIVLIEKNFDLSVGSTLALSGIVIVKILNSGINIATGFVIAILVGVIVGMINGFLVSYLNINSFIATLGMMLAVRGIAYIFSDSRPIYCENKNFSIIGNKILFGIPLTFIIFISLIIISYFILKNTRFGRNIYSIGGGSLESCMTIGINIKLNIFINFIVCGALASLSGILLASKISSGSPLLGGDTALVAIAAAILGGVSIYGGEGTTLSALFGVTILAIIANGLNLLAAQAYWQTIVKSLVLIVVIFADMYSKKKNKSNVKIFFRE